jgi:uncharacterized repeat protein (TIGR02543 family)
VAWSDPLVDPVVGSATYTATWSQDIYTVIFIVGDNGSLDGDTDFDGIIYGTPWDDAVTVPTPVADAGYRFTGWTPATEYPFPTTVTKNLTYTATFEFIDDLEVTFTSGTGGVLEDADGEVLVEPVSFPDISYNTPWADAVTVPAPVAEEGFHFVNWTPAFPGAVTESKTYTASFEPRDDLTVTFVAGADGTLDGEEFFGGISYGTPWADAVSAVPTPVPNTGYEFAGWTPTPFATTVTDDLIYTATFTFINDLTVTFIAGANGSLEGDDFFGGIDYDTAWTDAVTAPIAVADDGYRFTSWTPSFPSTVTESLTYTANFEFIDDLTVTFVAGANGSLDGDDFFDSIDYGTAWADVVDAVPTPVANEGYRFVNWTPSDPNNVAANFEIITSLTYTANFEFIDDLTVTFITDGNGTLTGTASFTGITYGTEWADAVAAIPTPVPATGYEFAGWTPTPFVTTVTDNLTYTANFTEEAPELYTVTYDGNGATSGVPAADSYVEGVLVVIPAEAPVREGYTFNGWFITEPSDIQVVNNIFAMPAADVTITARWTEIVVIELPDPYVLNVATNNLLTVVYGDRAPSDDEVIAALLDDIKAHIPAEYLEQLNLELAIDSAGIGEFVGSYEYNLDFDYNRADFSIVSPSYVQASLTIIPRPLTITVEDASKVFDGVALVAGSWFDSGLRLGDMLVDVTMSGSQTVVGSSASAITDYRILRDISDVKSNYAVTLAPGTLTVTAVPPVTVTPPTPPVTPPVAPVVPAAPGPAAFVPAPPAADEPALADEPAASIPDPEPPLAASDDDDDEATAPISDTETPLVDDTGSAWALVNLILTIVGSLLAFVVLVAFFIGRKEEKEKEENDERTRNEEDAQSERRRKRIGLRLVSLIAAAIAIIVFCITEDMTQPMQMVDIWTILHAIIFIVQIVLTVLATRKKSDDDTRRHAASQAQAA